MKIATFNIQNLYHRDKSLMTVPLGHNVKQWAGELDRLMQKHQKEHADFDRIRELSFLLGFERVDASRYAVLRKRNGRLYFQQRGFSNGMKASHLTNWNGWVAMQSIPLDKTSIANKAKVIAETDADVLLLQEVEDRASLVEFNKKMAMESDTFPYEQLTVIEGNNTDGLGMGILTKNGFVLDNIKNHIHDTDGQGNPLFDIDCPEYTIIAPTGEEIVIVDAQLSAIDASRRREQAIRVAQIYQRLVLNGRRLVMVTGTLNDAYFSDTLTPVLRETDLTDVSKCETFHVDQDKGKEASYFRMGAYRMGVNIQQREYLLLSPTLFSKLSHGGLHRKGVWQDRKPNWPIYTSMKHKRHAASEHPLVWAEILLR